MERFLKANFSHYVKKLRLLVLAFAKTLSPKEKSLLVVFILIFLVSGLYSLRNFWLAHTEELPEIGGEYREAIVGNPHYINPILALSNEADRDLTALIYSGLMKYNEKREIVPDLASHVEIADGGKTYIFTLRDDVFWHDRERFSAEDVLFTIASIQNAKYQSPIRVNWQGVSVEKTEDNKIVMRLANPYAPFIENTASGILPKHIWGNIDPKEFSLAPPNLKPIGTGTYKLKKIKKDQEGSVISIELQRNENYYGTKPLLAKISFTFFDRELDAIAALNKKEVDGMSFISPVHVERLRSLKSIELYSLRLPRYYAIFFNQSQSKPIADRNVRGALAHASNKQELIDTILGGRARMTHSPLIEGFLGYDPEVKQYEFSIEKARGVLDNAGWRDSDGDGIREKDGIRLELTLTTVDSPELTLVANAIAGQWEKVGIKPTVEVFDIQTIEERIRSRNYQALLFGEALGQDPDPFSFWHSSQKKDPGLNLALYSNKDVDKLLEEARQTLDPAARSQKYIEFQRILLEDLPALFLYSPDYLYPVNRRVKGIEIKEIVDPSKRFTGIEKWHVGTRRVWR